MLDIKYYQLHTTPTEISLPQKLEIKSSYLSYTLNNPFLNFSSIVFKYKGRYNILFF